MPFQFNINLESELDRLLGSYRIIIPSVVLQELSKLSLTNKHARAALDLAKKYEIMDIEEVLDSISNYQGEIDLAIIALAVKLKAIVVTNDKNLRNSLHTWKLSSIYLKSKSHLELD